MSLWWLQPFVSIDGMLGIILIAPITEYNIYNNSLWNNWITAALVIIFCKANEHLK